ncbi:MAG: YdeI/OmpD-associated family protein [Terrimicrobiaceae bacterium]|nr:YdeI/OmpD-associated family protein [Terrimicrobiaceae bacterium]
MNEPHFFESAAAWNRWLSKNHRQPASIWIQFAKKNSGIRSMSYADALEVAICWGWIDGQVKRLDETCYLQRWSSRRPRSRWSKINRDKASRLIESGKMKPAGLAQVAAAKADGRWDAAYDSPSTIREPDDFLASLLASPAALVAYEKAPRSRRYSLISSILDAKRPETRARRIAAAIASLSKTDSNQ